MTLKPITLASLIALATIAPPKAEAQGMVSFSFHAQDHQQAQAIQTGLFLYRLSRGIESGAFVHQDGTANSAALSQLAGSGSTGVIHQEGSGHGATLDQRGIGQSHGIFQFGRGASAHVVQRRPGQAGLTFQFGFD